MLIQNLKLTFRSKHNTEADMENLKEQIRKLEQDVEKWQNENKLLQTDQTKAKDALAQQVHRCHFLEKELKDAQSQLANLKSII